MRTDVEALAAYDKAPTLTEVESWCKARNSPVNPNRFYKYYDSLNWCLQNGKPIDDWRGLLQVWEKRELEWISKNQKQAEPRTDNPFLRLIQEGKV